MRVVSLCCHLAVQLPQLPHLHPPSNRFHVRPSPPLAACQQPRTRLAKGQLQECLSMVLLPEILPASISLLRLTSDHTQQRWI